MLSWRRCSRCLHQVSKHFSSRRNSFQSLLHLNGFSFDRDNNEQVAFLTDEGPNGYLCWPRELLAAIRRPNESLTDSKLTYIAYFWEHCVLLGDVLGCVH